ncbi:MAG: UvrD-helicase domain-containing protein [Clostridia bacterium]|nr:UvrD-helicase domain-containing protein [Clostridia bacterium]
MGWTKEQEKTITTTGKNILVSAAAGSGKTTVLVERIKNLVINEGADIDRFLITTFTKAAAAEMKERLETAFRKAGLTRQLQKLPASNISTFHSFAIEIIRQYFYLTDLEPGFGIADEVQMSIMKKEAIDKVFARRYREDFDRLREFLLKYGKNKGDDKLKENVLETYKTLVSIPDYMDWAKEKAQVIGGENPMANLGAYQMIAEEVHEELGLAAQEFEEAASLLDSENTPKIHNIALTEAMNATELYEKTTGLSGDWQQLKEKLSLLGDSVRGFSKERLQAYGKEKDFFDEELKKEVNSHRDAGKKIIDGVKSDYFNKPFDEYEQDLRDVYEDTLYYIDIIEEFIEVLKEAKADSRVIDFDDVMHYAIEILKSDQAADELREKFDYIFIDEYQDSNYLQEEIIRRIVRDDNLFMVGDVKQCIYKFRLAEPELFKDKARLYDSPQEEKSILLNLNSNFRSKKNVTEPINDMFSQVMEGYDDNSRLHCTAPDEYPGIPARIHVVNREDFDEAAPDRGEAEAAVIARIIREHLGQEIYDAKKGRVRKLRLADFAVIARNNYTVEEVERYLINDGIEAYGEGNGKYFETVEVKVFINLLRIISNMRQDVPLISAMKSVVFGFSIGELVEIRTQSREGSFYSSVMSYARQGRDEKLRTKIFDMIRQIDLWKEISRTVPLEELMKTILYDTGYYDYCSGLPVGVQRISNLRLIAEKAAKYEEISHGGLYGFLKYIDTMEESGENDSEAKVLSENEDVVRVMSVHKSKGLEFPVVIFANASKSTSNSNKGGAITIHRDYGIGLPKVDRAEHWHRKTFLQQLIAKTREDEMIEEEIRILYVALTRAKDCIEIVGSVAKEEGIPNELSKKTFLSMIYEPFSNRPEVELVEYDDVTALEQAHDMRMHKAAELYKSAEELKSAGTEEETAELIDRRLSYVYQSQEGTQVKPKYSVSELNGSNEVSGEVYLSEFAPNAEETVLSAAQVGTVMHLLMEKTDFAKAAELDSSGITGKEYIQTIADGLLAEKTISTAEYDAINVDNAHAFFTTDAGKRAASAFARGKLHKEKEFILEKSIDDVKTVVQGVIDCYFEEDGGLVLIDYKNSYMRGGRSEEDVAETYREQIELYKEALEGATGRKVRESYLFMFDTGRFIRV